MTALAKNEQPETAAVDVELSRIVRVRAVNGNHGVTLTVVGDDVTIVLPAQRGGKRPPVKLDHLVEAVEQLKDVRR